MADATYNTHNPQNDNTNRFSHLFSKVFEKVTAKINQHFQLGCSSSEELASQALEYAARYFLYTNPDAELTESSLTNIATWKANNLAKDCFRRRERRPDNRSLDSFCITRDDSEEPAESPLIQRASYDHYRQAEADRQWRELGHYAYAHLGEMFDCLRVNPLHRAVFRAVYLESCPVNAASEHFGIKPNYVYGIIFNVKAGLAKIGPAFLRAA